jgi:hypothetical protein
LDWDTKAKRRRGDVMYAHAPFLPELKPEKWIVILTSEIHKKNEILAMQPIATPMEGEVGPAHSPLLSIISCLSFATKHSRS